MPGCGYVCSQCEGRGYLDDGSYCDVCAGKKLKPTQSDLDAWVSQVHEGPCCEDRG